MILINIYINSFYVVDSLQIQFCKQFVKIPLSVGGNETSIKTNE